MTNDTWMEQPENQQLDYKSTASLDQPRGLARAVAAMLNASGGKIVIGIREEREHAVEVQGVDDIVAKRRRLEDALCDLLEPPWSSDLGQVRETTVAGKPILIVECRSAGEHGPVAVLHGKAREYPIRVGARTRPMSRAELAEAFAGVRGGSAFPQNQDERNRALRSLLDFRGRMTDPEKFSDRFWISSAPIGGFRLPIDDDDERRRHVEQLLMDPEASGNRASGFCVMNSTERPATRAHSIGIGDPDDAIRSLWIDTRGFLRFHCCLDVLAFNPPGRSGRDIYPYVLSELLASFVRLQRRIVEEFDQDADRRFLLDAGMAGAKGWSLGPGSPRDIRHRIEKHRSPEEDSIVWPDPIEYGRADLNRDDDAVAFRAVLRIYREFGMDTEDLPREWDRDRRRLSFSA